MTREEKLELLNRLLEIEENNDIGNLTRTERGEFQQWVKALEQEPILDKIRAEIEALPKTYPFINHIDTYVKEDDVKKIIDKYKAEMESEE